MAQCFLSYCTRDREFAEEVRALVASYGVSVFMAESSLSAGDRWSGRIQDELRESSHVIFLASEEACRSPYVLQEVGGAVTSEKELIPVVWDVDPGSLPGWAAEYQALDLRDLDPSDIRDRLREVAEAIPTTPGWLTAVIVAGLGLVFWAFLRPGAAQANSVEGEDRPSCPNCSTREKPFYLRPIPEEFSEIEGVTHECRTCGFAGTYSLETG